MRLSCHQLAIGLCMYMHVVHMELHMHMGVGSFQLNQNLFQYMHAAINFDWWKLAYYILHYNLIVLKHLLHLMHAVT
jgi:hypothetical protein